ncbi:MAG: SRPBCC domain-containing protein [Acidobacteriota bacterium]
MSTTASPTDTFTITESILVRASIEKTFASLLVQMGRQNQTHEGVPMPMVIEPHPGGRWYRTLGGDDGHLWGFVQSIKRNSLLEIWGPLFMSTGAMSNLQYRLAETDDGTMITFTHTMFGPFPENMRQNIGSGWTALHERVRTAAEEDGGDLLA